MTGLRAAPQAFPLGQFKRFPLLSITHFHPGLFLMRARGQGPSMADLIIVFWRDIPAQIIVKKGRTTAKRELSLRFTEAIDMAAMRSGAAATDAYLAEWRKADPIPVGEDLEAEAEAARARIEAEYPKERLVALVHTHGKAG
jgi:hypothetical protein